MVVCWVGSSSAHSASSRPPSDVVVVVAERRCPWQASLTIMPHTLSGFLLEYCVFPACPMHPVFETIGKTPPPSEGWPRLAITTVGKALVRKTAAGRQRLGLSHSRLSSSPEAGHMAHTRALASAIGQPPSPRPGEPVCDLSYSGEDGEQTKAAGRRPSLVLEARST